jgi:hypothetical protein
MPQQAADLDPWDAVILSDIARTAISDAAMGALAQWVERDGGGLLVTGGEAVFGEAGDKGGPPGYRNTELERLTPSRSSARTRRRSRSSSSSTSRGAWPAPVMELCKSAAQAPWTCSPTSTRLASSRSMTD